MVNEIGEKSVMTVVEITQLHPTTITVKDEICSRECSYLEEMRPASGSGYVNYYCALYRCGLYSRGRDGSPWYGRERCEECVSEFGMPKGTKNETQAND